MNFIFCIKFERGMDKRDNRVWISTLWNFDLEVRFDKTQDHIWLISIWIGIKDCSDDNRIKFENGVVDSSICNYTYVDLGQFLEFYPNFMMVYDFFKSIFLKFVTYYYFICNDMLPYYALFRLSNILLLFCL